MKFEIEEKFSTKLNRVAYWTFLDNERMQLFDTKEEAMNWCDQRARNPQRKIPDKRYEYFPEDAREYEVRHTDNYLVSTKDK